MIISPHRFEKFTNIFTVREGLVAIPLQGSSLPVEVPRVGFLGVCQLGERMVHNQFSILKERPPFKNLYAINIVHRADIELVSDLFSRSDRFNEVGEFAEFEVVRHVDRFFVSLKVGAGSCG